MRPFYARNAVCNVWPSHLFEGCWYRYETTAFDTHAVGRTSVSTVLHR